MKRGIKDGIYQLIMMIIGIAMVFPILYALSLSLMRPDSILSSPPKLITKDFYFQNYVKAVTTTLLGRYTINSFLVAGISSLFRLLIASMAAFAFSFFEFPLKRILFALTLATLMIPPDVLVVTNYITVSEMGLLNTYAGICVVYLVSAMNIFLFRQHFLSFSKDLKEAAYIDGCGNVRFYTRILIPTSKPIMVTVFISSFISVWNQYLWPMVITNRDEMRTVQVGVAMLKFPEGTAYGPLMAGAVIALLPTVLLFVLFQKKIVGGMLTGSVKG